MSLLSLLFWFGVAIGAWALVMLTLALFAEHDIDGPDWPEY